jgi:hypothetical protein
MASRLGMVEAVHKWEVPLIYIENFSSLERGGLYQRYAVN